MRGALCIAVVLAGLLSVPGARGADEVRHSVRLTPPGAPPEDKVEAELVQVKGAPGEPDTFYMDVQSVTCGDHRCKPVTVRLFWDELGFYRRYVVASDFVLEKGDGEPFTAEDLEKLDRVIARRESGLRTVKFSNVADYQSPGGDVDAVTAPTVPLDLRDYVKGAFWTSYTLWHWANGEVPVIIRNLTGKARSLDQLRHELLTGDREHRLFALEQLQTRRATYPESLEAAVRGAAGGDYELRKSLVAYVELLDADAYYATLERLMREGDADLRRLCLDSMKRSRHRPPDGYVERLSRDVAAAASFQEIDLLLGIVERWKAASPEVIESLLPLLEGEDFLVARRVYWFLREQKLSMPQRKAVEAFAQKNASRL